MKKLIIGILLVGLPIFILLSLLISILPEIVILLGIAFVVVCMFVSISKGFDLLIEWERQRHND